MSPRTKTAEIDLAIADVIRIRRMKLGMTQSHVADLAGVTYQQAHKYETGTNRITAGQLCRIAAALGMSPGEIFEAAGQGQVHPVDCDRCWIEHAREFREFPAPLRRAMLDAAKAMQEAVE